MDDHFYNVMPEQALDDRLPVRRHCALEPTPSCACALEGAVVRFDRQPDIDRGFAHNFAPRGPFHGTDQAFFATRGALLLWPPWLVHEVPNAGWSEPDVINDRVDGRGDERIAFAFNLVR